MSCMEDLTEVPSYRESLIESLTKSTSRFHRLEDAHRNQESKHLNGTMITKRLTFRRILTKGDKLNFNFAGAIRH